MKVKKSVRMACLVTVFVLATTMLCTGCSNSGNTGTATTVSQASTQSTTQASTEKKEELAPVTLKFYMPPPTSDLSNKDSVLAEVNKLLKPKINATLDITFADWASYQTKINVMMSSGEHFDMFLSIGYLDFPTTVSKGAVLPIDDLLNKYGSTILKMTPEKLWSAATMNGKKYGTINVMPYASWAGCMYQKELVDKYNFDYKSVKTLKDLEPFLAQIKAGEKGITPLLPLGSLMRRDIDERYDQVALSDTQGFSYIAYDTVDNKLVNLSDSPMYIERLKTLSDWYKKGYIAKDASLKKDGTAEAKTKKYAVMGTNGVATDDGVKETSLTGFPTVSTKQGLGMIITRNVNGVMTYISSTSENPERAMMFLDTLWSDKKIFNTLCFGVEGQDYDVVSGAGTDNPTVKTRQPAKWAIWHPWIAEMNHNEWPSDWNDEKALEEFRVNNDTAKTSPIMGFVFNAEPVKEEAAKIGAYLADMYYTGATGSFPDADKYIADCKSKMDADGYAKVFAEAEKQLAAWKSANGK